MHFLILVNVAIKCDVIDKYFEVVMTSVDIILAYRSKNDTKPLQIIGTNIVGERIT